MKSFLIVILASCAVKCDETTNDVLQSSEEPPIRTSRPSLRVYWNVPTGKKCHEFDNLYEKYGIIQNKNDSFAGNKITILYDPGSFPALLQNKSTGAYVFRNGGLPQEGSWDLHETEFRRAIDESIPDKDFNGVGIIDFESWRPVYRQNFGKLSPYKDYSYKAERRRHPLWPPSWVENEAKRRFESSARLFMDSTLSLAKKLRPNALWGYYGFPYCFNMQNKPLVARCSDGVPQENDQISWLWEGSTALFPSVYSSSSLTSYQLTQLVSYRVKEAARVRRNGTPILPYFWYRYRDDGFLREADLSAFLKTIYNSQASGFIIWGSYNDVNSPAKCESLFNYLKNIMGPAIAKYTKNNAQHDEVVESSNELNHFYPPKKTNTTTQSPESVNNNTSINEEKSKFDIIGMFNETENLEEVPVGKNDSLFNIKEGHVEKSYEMSYEDEDEDEPLKRGDKRLKVYWNIPTGKKCNGFDNIFEKYGIIQNNNDTFEGNKFTILYDPGSFPALIEDKKTGKTLFRNGGLPQEGSWDIHEMEFKRAVDERIPDPDFDGVAIIDFESWRPIFRQNFGKLTPYKNYSYELEQQKHPDWNSTEVKIEAEQRFESSALLFMQSTLVMAKDLRPKALWGYYGFPYCFNMQNSPLVPTCSDTVMKQNDLLYWLWDESTVLSPSVYSSKTLTSDELSQLVLYRVKEAARVKRVGAPILPYFWYLYREGGYFKEADLSAFLKTIYNSQAAGFIIWGSYNDVNSPEKCESLFNYLKNVMGPAIAKYTRNNAQHDEVVESSNEQNHFYPPKNTNTTNQSPESINYKTNINEEKSKFDNNGMSLKRGDKRLKVYWNIPTGKKCKGFDNLFEKYGIFQNNNDTFEGDKFTILYDPGSFPALIEDKKTGKNVFRNGGLPQEGSWDIHEMEFKRAVDEKIPDPDFDGVAIIDFESWRPIFRQNFGTLTPYKNYSYELEQQKHPDWNSTEVKIEAEQRFENGAQLFMQSTLVMAKDLRPKALWGYYGFPYCFNMQNSPLVPTCSDTVMKENDLLYWLWDESTVLSPSVYSSNTLTSDELSQLVLYRVKEAARVKRVGAPILPYFWYLYREGGYFKEEDLVVFLKTIYNSPASGFIIWGSYNDVNSQEECFSLLEYLDSIMGPAIAKYTKLDDEGDHSNEIDHSVSGQTTTASLKDISVNMTNRQNQINIKLENLVPDLGYEWINIKNYSEIHEDLEIVTQKPELTQIVNFILNAFSDRSNENILQKESGKDGDLKPEVMTSTTEIAPTEVTTTTLDLLNDIVFTDVGNANKSNKPSSDINTNLTDDNFKITTNTYYIEGMSNTTELNLNTETTDKLGLAYIEISNLTTEALHYTTEPNS